MPSRLLAGLPERGLQAAIGPGDLFSDDSNLDVTSWGVVFTSCGLFVFSAVSLIAGCLELVGILGQVCCIRTWIGPNVVMFIAWWPVMGVSAWLHAPAQGVKLIIVIIAVSAAAIVCHLVVLVCYWVRHVRWARMARELPTQQLLTEAQREVALQLGLPQPSAQSSPASLRSAGASPAHDRNSATATSAVVDAVNPTFQLQYGCADGGYDYTLYIPAEAEEQALVRVLREHVARQAQAHSPPSPPRAPLLGPGRNPINLGFHRSSAMHRRYDASDAPAPAAAVGSARPDQERDDSSEPPHSPKTGSLSMITACFGVGMEGARASSGGGGSSPHQNSLARPDGGRPQGVHAKSRSQGAGAGAAFQDLLRAVGEKEQSAPMLGGFDSSGGIGPPACSSAAQVDVAAKLPPLPAAPVQSSSSSSGGSNAALPPRPHHHGHTHTLGEKTTGSVGAGGGGAFQLRSRKHRRSRSLPLTSSRSLHRALLTLDEREDEGEDSDREQPPKAAPPQPPQPPTEAQPTNANGAAPTYTPTPHVQGSSSSTSALAKARRQVAALLPPRTPPRAPAAEGGSRGGGKEKEEGGGAGVEASGSGPGRGSSQPGGRRDSL